MNKIKRGIYILVLFSIIILTTSIVSAGFFSDFWGKITGWGSEEASIDLNISVTTGTVPWIYAVTDPGAITLTDGPGATYVIINFSVNDSDGADNLDNSSAMLNFTKAGEDLRINSTCAVKDYEGNFANYTCKVTMWWWDIDASDWTIYANISDLNENTHVNSSNTFTVNTLTGLTMSPSSLNFASLLAGATNQTPSDYLSLNNTGNKDITDGNVKVNATDLFGETDKGQALWAGNFSMSPSTGGYIECNASTTDATAMVNMTDTGVVGSTLDAGNFTKNDGTAQEKLYLCLREIGSELSQQHYSTNQLGSWAVKIVVP